MAEAQRDIQLEEAAEVREGLWSHQLQQINALVNTEDAALDNIADITRLKRSVGEEFQVNVNPLRKPVATGNREWKTTILINE